MIEKSKLREELEAGRFVVTAEICPPRGTDTARSEEHTSELQSH